MLARLLGCCPSPRLFARLSALLSLGRAAPVAHAPVRLIRLPGFPLALRLTSASIQPLGAQIAHR